MTEQHNELIHLTIDVVTAFVGQNNMRPEDVPALIASVHKAVSNLLADGETSSATAGADANDVPAEFPPAVTARKSLGSREHIISMIDGKPYKTLKRHLGQHGLTPAQYRERYSLKPDYPMVAPAYSEARKAMALKIGLGQKVTSKARAETTTLAPKVAAQSAAKLPTAVAAKSPVTPKAPAKRAARKTTKPAAKSAVQAAPKTAGVDTENGSKKAPAKRGRPPKAVTSAATAAAE